MADPVESPEVKEYRRKFTKQPSPFALSDWFSQLFFRWLDPIIDVATKTDFKQDMHYNLRPEDTASADAQNLEREWNKEYPVPQLEVGTKTPIMGLLKTIWRTFWIPLSWSVVGHLTVIIVEFINAYLIYRAIQSVSKIDYSLPLSTSQEQLNEVWLYMGLFIFLKVCFSCFYTYLAFRLSLVGLRLRNALNILLFKKLMRKSLDRDTTFDMGDITNLSQVDSQAFANLGFQAGFIIGIPFKITLGIIALYWMMGTAMLLALSILVLVAGINVYISTLYDKYKSNIMRFSDIRGKLTNEVFKNIRFIKMVGLENYYLIKLSKAREDELFWIRKQFIRNCFANLNNNFGPAMFMAVLFACRLKLTGTLRLSEAFVSGIVFGIFQQSIRSIAWYVVFVLDCMVSGRRICFFLLSEEVNLSFMLKGDNRKSIHKKNNDAVTIERGNFYWVDKKSKQWYADEKNRIGGKEEKKVAEKKNEGDEKMIEMKLLDNQHIGGIQVDNYHDTQHELVLKDIYLTIPKGACVGIIGKVGSGKSSLLSALIGELYVEPGTQVSLSGEVAYVSQKAWITSHSIKDVIIFGNPYDDAKFKECIRCSGMEDDLKGMAQAENTMLGDRGVNLSGGQKTRLSIARAFYANKDIYLFDDPISALDVHVGKTVMEEGILTYLKGKTVIVATHAIAYLPYFDYILIMDKGKIIERGKYEEIINTPSYLEIKKVLQPDEPQSPATPLRPSIGDEISRLSQRKFSIEDALERSSSIHGSVKQINSARDATEKGKAAEAVGKTKTDEVIDHIISTEDKAKGDVVTMELFKKYVNYSGGSKIFIIIFTCMLF